MTSHPHQPSPTTRVAWQIDKKREATIHVVVSRKKYAMLGSCNVICVFANSGP